MEQRLAHRPQDQFALEVTDQLGSAQSRLDDAFDAASDLEGDLEAYIEAVMEHALSCMDIARGAQRRLDKSRKRRRRR